MRTRKTVVILLSGKAGSGKSTASNILKTKLLDIPAMTVFQYSFAGPLKYIAESFIRWDGKKDEKGRKLLQDIGRVGREYDQDIWAKHLLNQMDKKAGLLPFNFVIVDDWRFPNEMSFLKNNGLLEVVTIRMFGRQAHMSTEAELDTSEISLPETSVEKLVFDDMGMYQFAIDNTENDINYLESKLDVILAEITKRFILE